MSWRVREAESRRKPDNARRSGMQPKGGGTTTAGRYAGYHRSGKRQRVQGLGLLMSNKVFCLKNLTKT